MALTKEAIVREAVATLRGGAAAVQRMQEEKLAALVRHARAHSAYYRQRLAHLPEEVRDVAALPVLTKQDLMGHFDDIVTDPAVKLADVERFVADKSLVGTRFGGKYWVFNTSGTTGKPAYFLHDWDAMTSYNALTDGRMWAMWLTPQRLAALQKSTGRIAVCAATGGHFGGAGIVEFGRSQLPDPSIAQIFDVKMGLDELVAKLNDFDPAVCSGYATAWLVLAGEAKAGRLKMRPNFILSGAETLRPDMRAEIQAAFSGVNIVDVYAASECFGMAFDCGSGWLHVNTDYCILEPVDANYQRVRPGETAHTTLLTNLSNRLQPLIRYDIGDRLTPKGEPCECGNPLPVVKIEGRTDDILFARSASGRAVPLMPKAIGAVIEESAGLQKYQLVQVAADELTLRIEPEPGHGEREVWSIVAGRVREYLRQQGLENVSFARDPTPPQRDPQSGKFRHAWAVASVKGWHKRA